MPGKSFMLGLLAAGSLHAADVTITVTGVRNDRGKVAALVFTRADGFPDVVKSAARQSRVPAKPGTVKLTFKNLPAGRYAISVLHDENNDGKLATNMLGIPREGVGVTNGVGKSKPKFDKAVITVNPGDNLTIPLRYW